MSKHIYRCPNCLRYTLNPVCPGCKSKTEPPKPPKFSTTDKYGEYRRQVKKQELIDKGLY